MDGVPGEGREPAGVVVDRWDLERNVYALLSGLAEAVDFATAVSPGTGHNAGVWETAVSEAHEWLRAVREVPDAVREPAALRAAAAAFLARIDDITTDKFQRGGDRAEREALREAIGGGYGAGGGPREVWLLVRLYRLDAELRDAVLEAFERLLNCCEFAAGDGDSGGGV